MDFRAIHKAEDMSVLFDFIYMQIYGEYIKRANNFAQWKKITTAQKYLYKNLGHTLQSLQIFFSLKQ